MISNSLKSQYMQILAQCRARRKECFTQSEISRILGVSLRKYVDFENGKIIDFVLLDQLAGLVCYDLKVDIYQSDHRKVSTVDYCIERL